LREAFLPRAAQADWLVAPRSGASPQRGDGSADAGKVAS
jgi:hypothetical protein